MLADANNMTLLSHRSIRIAESRATYYPRRSRQRGEIVLTGLVEREVWQIQALDTNLPQDGDRVSAPQPRFSSHGGPVLPPIPEN